MDKKVKILGIPGSLRKNSHNKGLLLAALETAPSDCHFEIFDLATIPLYNQDEENPLPQAVVHLKNKIRAADGILMAIPEYNYSMPGVLKNAIDWASRPYGDSAWAKKSVAIMGASPAILGTARAQYHLRQVFVGLNMYPLNQPELMVGSAHSLFDAQGMLTDAKTRQRVTDLLKALIVHARNHS